MSQPSHITMSSSNVEVPQEWHFHNCRLYSTEYDYKVIVNVIFLYNTRMDEILYFLHLNVTKHFP